MDFFNQKIDTSLQEGIIGCILSTSYFQTPEEDGSIDFLNAVLAYQNRDIFKGMDPTEIGKKEIAVRGSKNPDEYLKICCSKINDEWKSAVFAICADLIFKDHIITAEERNFLKSMKEYMNLSDTQASTILEVISLLYKGRM